MIKRGIPNSERITCRVITDERGCWLWTGAVMPNGYGTLTALRADGTSATRSAHRVAYEVFKGPIPDGLDLDHLCRVRRCVNPDHLEPVTRLENVRRGLGYQKPACRNGHAYTPENTYRPPQGGSPRCRVCQRAQTRRQAEARKAMRRAA